MTRACIVAAVLLAAGCSNAPDDAARGTSPPAAAPSGPVIVGKAPRGAIVSLVPHPPREMPLPEGPAIMDQYAKQFVPDMLLVRVGQQVEFRNSEDSPHNVNVNRIPTGAEIFNVATAPYQKYVHTFDQPGQYAVACDIHPGMTATLVATTTPYAAIVDDSGNFSWSDVPPGDYTLSWVLNGKTSEKKVSVSPARTEITVP